MTVNSVVIFVPDDTRRTGRSVPLMLERVQGVPLLSWLAASLAQDGAHRFFLVAQPGCMAQAKACFPQDLELTVCAEQDPADLLHVFLSTTEETEPSVAVITGPVVYLRSKAARPEGRVSRRTAVCLADREELMEALDFDFSFSHFLVEHASACKEEQGFYSVSDYEELLDWQRAMNRDQLFRLAHNGVNIWDLENCYVNPWSMVGEGTELLPGTVLVGKNNIGSGCTLGPNAYLADCSVGDGARIVSSRAESAAIGPDCQVGPYANLRPGSNLGPASVAGSFVEMERTTLGARTNVPHFACLGDTAFGQDCSVGSGVTTANFDRVTHYDTTVEDGAFLGCHATLVAPVHVGKGTYVAAGSVVTQDAPDGALVIARSRQTNKKEWANKHKK